MTNKILWFSIIVLYLINLFIPLLEIDAAQFAEISRELLSSKNILHLYDSGLDYLDKPPFLFWISALFMKIFGMHTWVFKLPSTLIILASFYALYQFTLLYYSKEIAHKTLIIFATCQAAFLMTNDIRVDNYLMSFMMFSFYYFAKWLEGISKFSYITSAFFLALALLSKGPIALVVFAFGIIPHLIIKKKWNYFFRWQYLVMLLIIGILLIPMLYGLYTQFDLQTDKLVNGSKNVSGIKFYFWTQSFGRITGESQWNNHTPFYFLYSNALWLTFPFTLIFIIGSILVVKKFFHFPKQIEWISISACALTLFALSLSKYQLPHYIYIFFPFLALSLARTFRKLENDLLFSKFLKFYFVVLNILVATLVIVLFNLFQVKLYFIIFVLALLILLFSLSIRKKIKLISFAFLAILLNLYLSLSFYPNLVKYQCETSLCKKIKEDNIALDNICTFIFRPGRSFDFNLNFDFRNIHDLAALKDYQFAICDNEGLQILKENKHAFKIVKEVLNFPVSKLNMQFLNPNTRKDVCKQIYLIAL